MEDRVVRCPAYTAAQTATASVRVVSCGATALVAGPGDYITIEVGQSTGNPVLKLRDASGKKQPKTTEGGREYGADDQDDLGDFCGRCHGG
jgi:hypothetical protein